MNDGNFLLSTTKKFDLIEGQWEEIYSNLEKEILFSYYEPLKSSKRYFFLWSNREPEEQLEQANELIEDYLEFSVIPQDTYLVLFSRVADLSEQSYKKIIKVEENEFCYKKYVCYYTKDELKELRNKSDEILKNEVNFFESYPEYNKADAFTLLYRMIIKIPIIKMEFKKKELEGFHNLYESVRKKTDSFTLNQIKDMEDMILPCIKEDDGFEEDIASLVDEFIKEIYGGDINEYLS